MKKIVLIIILVSVSFLFAENEIWSNGTAKTLPKGRIEVGIFQPFRYGLNETTELSTFLLADLLIPNITMKKSWNSHNGIEMTSEHSIIYPTPLLNLMAREGAGGILPNNSIIPEIIVYENQLLFSYQISENHIFTPKIGYSIAFVSGESDFPTLDLPLVYNRTSIYHNGAMFNFGFDFCGTIIPKLDYLIDFDKFMLDKEYAEFSYEHKLMLIWKINRKFAISGGYKLAYSDYPSPKQRNADFFPLIDFRMGFK